MVDGLQQQKNEGAEGEPQGLPSAVMASAELTQRKATAAMASVAVVGGYNFIVSLLGVVGAPATLLQVAQIFSWVPLILGAVFFCQWFGAAYRNTRTLGSAVLRFSPSQAVMSFFVPIVNIVRPFQALRALYDASDPTPLPDPPQYRVRAVEADYRATAREPIPSPAWRLPFPIVPWWITYMGVPLVLIIPVIASASAGASAFTRELGIIQGVANLAAAGFAIQLVRAIGARQSERLRRLQLAKAAAGTGPAAGPEPAQAARQGT